MSNTILEFANENLWIGNLGQSLVVFSILSSLLSAYFYFKSVGQDLEGNNTYYSIARKLFIGHSIAIVGIFITLFSIIFMHRYEYIYAYKHSSNSLPVYYMISCFWEGQEGSFLLWMFWNAVLGCLILRKKGIWEKPVMAIVAFAQFALATMLLGIQTKIGMIGSSPFELTRIASPEMLQIPVFGNIPVTDYLKIYKDGKGLNPLLQNYWMVIHPPTLFFGFATALIPFAYSIAGLWLKKHKEWMQPALVWSLICVGILGLGIIMGGYWAYESLSFGGYWAWDPVENASLMPWLIMAAAAHMLLISKATGRHLFTSHLLIQLAFWLVLYATFLTRSGILGEASVHSFVDLGLSGQLLIFIFSFIFISLLVSIENKKMKQILIVSFILLVLLNVLQSHLWPSGNSIFKWINILSFLTVIVGFCYFLYKRTANSMDEEKWLSREIWMFVGSMFLILCLIHVISGTSMPVINKVFGLRKTVPKAEDYNYYQLWLAMPVMLLMAVGQWFKYRETPWSMLRIDLLRILILSLIVSILLVLAFEIYTFKYALFLFFSVALIVGNLLYVNLKKWRDWTQYGSVLAHAGFGILLLGVLVSSVNKTILTASQDGIQFQPELNADGKVDANAVKFNRNNQILEKNRPITTESGYVLTYKGFKIGGIDSQSKFYQIDFAELKNKKELKDIFTLNPEVQDNPKFGKAANPSTKHYIHKDIYTHVTFESENERQEPWSNFKLDSTYVGGSIVSSSGKVQLTVLRLIPVKQNWQELGMPYMGEVGILCEIMAKRGTDTATLLAGIAVSNNQIIDIPAENNRIGIKIASALSIPDKSNPKPTVRLSIAEREPFEDYIVVQAIVFPWINLVWMGTILMVIGFALSVGKRILQNRKLGI